MYRSSSIRFVTQSTLRTRRSGSPARSASSASPHSRTSIAERSSAPRRSMNRAVFSWYSVCRSSAVTSRPFASFTVRVHDVSWLISRIARIGFSKREVAHHGVRLHHPQHEVGDADLHEGRPLAHVRVADDHVEPTVALRVGVRLVAGVDDRATPGGRARDALPDVLGALRDAVLRAARPVEHLAGPAPDLAGDEERDQHVCHPGELALARHEVVLVATVGVARAVGVVLEQVDVARDALLVQAELGGRQQVLQDALPRLVVGHHLADVVAFGRRVLGVRAHVEVEARAVLEEHVRGAPPVHDAAEQVPRHLVGRQPPLPPEGAGDAVFVLDAEDPSLHTGARVCPAAANDGRRGSARERGLDLDRRQPAELPAVRSACDRARPASICSAGTSRVSGTVARTVIAVPHGGGEVPAGRVAILQRLAQFLGVAAHRHVALLVGDRAVEQDVVDRACRSRRRRPRRPAARSRRASSAA